MKVLGAGPAGKTLARSREKSDCDRSDNGKNKSPNVRFWRIGVLAGALSFVSLFGAKLPAGWTSTAIRAALHGLLFYWLLTGPVTQPQGSGATANRRLSLFDPLIGLRALACLMVLSGHYFMILFPFTDSNPGVRALLRSSPWAGVWLFFTLSGYLMGKGFTSGRYGLNDAGSRAFWRNRARRIVPVYLAALLLVSIYRYSEIFQTRNLWMLLDMLMFDYRGDLPINPIGALWSVSTEVQFYILTPFLVLLLVSLQRRLGQVFFLAPMLLLLVGTGARVWLSSALSETAAYSHVYTPVIANLDLFLVGASISLMPRLHLTQQMRRPAGLVLIASAGVFYIGACCLTSGRPHLGLSMAHFWAVGPLPCVLFASCFIYLSSQLGAVEMQGAMLRGLAWIVTGIGSLTYCLYVLHPEIFIINSAARIGKNDLLSSLSFLPITGLQLVAVASFFYLLVERPFESRKRVAGELTGPP